ncbi:hypothetical protein [Burkholderia cepacia]|uniref:hypothetical protein n=1 Tax=Burkholderia cepacia TaxID=292 RepID=UPI002FE08E89
MAQAFANILKPQRSFTEPGLILSYTQQSGAFNMLAGGAPDVKIDHYDQYVYGAAIFRFGYATGIYGSADWWLPRYRL